MSTFAADLARRCLLRRLRELPGEPLGVEEVLLDVLAHTVRAHDEAPPPGFSRPITGQLRSRVESARLFLAENHCESLRLADVANAVGGSPYPLCRAFRTLTGRSIHQHLVSLRLRAALDEIEAGSRDLTALALRVGFSSHAHFTDSFRAAYGQTPSGARGARASR